MRKYNKESIKLKRVKQARNLVPTLTLYFHRRSCFLTPISKLPLLLFSALFVLFVPITRLTYFFNRQPRACVRISALVPPLTCQVPYSFPFLQSLDCQNKTTDIQILLRPKPPTQFSTVTQEVHKTAKSSTYTD
jgi:hypothetical protein